MKLSRCAVLLGGLVLLDWQRNAAIEKVNDV